VLGVPDLFLFSLIMGRFRTSGNELLKALLLLAPLVVCAQGAAADEPLKLIVSLEQQTVVAPFAARVTLHLHNAGSVRLWLFRHVRGKLPPPLRLLDEDSGPQTTGGSILTVRLEQASTEPGGISHLPEGEVFESVGLPKPALVGLAPGEDYEEKASIRLAPAISEVQKPLWGAYRLTLTYKAEYSNAEEIHRDLKANLWQGEVSSNTIDVQLAPPTPDSRGEVSGTVDTQDNAPISGAIVSLNDKMEHLVGQTESDPDGKYSFSTLPPGLYWVTARHKYAGHDTAVFRHVDLTNSQPSATQDVILIPQEIYEPQKMLHKPVLFRITDNAGAPLDRVGIEATFSNGELVENVKGETGTDGAVALSLIPGRNFVALKRKGCPKQDERADVAPGDGIGAFAFTFDCAKK
jgi:hypothetical protein